MLTLPHTSCILIPSFLNCWNKNVEFTLIILFFRGDKLAVKQFIVQRHKMEQFLFVVFCSRTIFRSVTLLLEYVHLVRYSIVPYVDDQIQNLLQYYSACHHVSLVPMPLPLNHSNIHHYILSFRIKTINPRRSYKQPKVFNTQISLAPIRFILH